MTDTRILILAAGDGERWGNHHDRPKHFAWVCGEHLIERTVRQVLERDPGADVRIVVHDLGDDRYKIPGTKRATARHDPALGNADKVLSARHVWHRTGRTVMLHGDVFYTDDALDEILADRPGWHLYGRPGPSQITGKDWNENFALAFDADAQQHIVDATRRIVALADAGFVPSGINHSCWYLAAVGVPDHQVIDWTRHVGTGHFVAIDDWTDDFDTPAEYDMWCWRWATADPDSRPLSFDG